jgi:hypothetical protein
MQRLLSEEEYNELIHAKELAKEKVCAEMNLKLEEIKKTFIDSMERALKNTVFGTRGGWDYSSLLPPIREALKKLRL